MHWSKINILQKNCLKSLLYKTGLRKCRPVLLIASIDPLVKLN